MYTDTIKPLQRRSGYFIVAIFTLFYALLSQTVYAATESGNWEAVSGIAVDKGRRLFDTTNRVFYTTNKLINNSGADLNGPVRLVVTSSNYQVLNASGTDSNGKPYFDVLDYGEALANGATSDGTRINFKPTRAAFAYTVEVQRWVETIVDTDSDGIPDSSDACPFDPENDVDGDGICGDVDSCPFYANNDEDGDGICGDVDSCPLDPENDVDGDGICGDVDSCPLDANNDEDGDGICGNLDACPTDPTNDVDGDGICGNEDFCPTDATNSCVAINGQVFGNGAALNGASVKVGTQADNKITLTDSVGIFSVIGLGSTQSAHDNLNDFFPVEVSVPGFSSGYAKVVFEKGKTNYDVTVNLQPVSDNFTADDDLNAGVEINKAGNAVGQLTIPDSSLPDGVTDVTGSVTYLDPTTDDILSAPGGDLLALPAGVDPNTATPVPLESFGMMEFDLKDQDGNPIHELGGDAEVCMKATPGLNAGDSIPLWYYDESTGLWKEEGQGTVQDKNGQLMICGNVQHFTWWNYDQPINTHSCFKFDVRDETSGVRLSATIDWQAEGVTYSGTSPERACAIDSNDPNTGGDTIDSLTVKKSEGSTIEQIRVFAYIGNSQYYLKRDGDGTYSLTQNQADATVFDNPSQNASCLNNSNVDQCAFLDYLDGVDADGILPLSADINYPPVISNFNITDGNGALTSNLLVGESANVQATVTDPEGTSVKIDWTTDCSWYSQSNPGSIFPGSEDFQSSPYTFIASYTAPSSLSYPVEWCRITATATDSDGISSSAEQSVYVTGSYDYVVEGVLYGTDGQPMPNVPMQYHNYSCNNVQYQELTTDSAGHYTVQFNMQNCSGEDFYYDLGSVNILYVYDNIQRTHYEHLNDYYLENNGCTVQDNAATQCVHDIRLPTVWGPLSGNLYPVDGFSVDAMEISSHYVHGSDFTWIYPDESATNYGPVMVPIGFNVIYGYFNNNNLEHSMILEMPSTDGAQQDFGDFMAPLTVTVFDGEGGPQPGVSVSLQNWSCSSSGCDPVVVGTTDNNGQFTADMPGGQVQIWETNLYSFYGYGQVGVKDQAVIVDINSPDLCTVSGVAYDLLGLPIAEGIYLSAYSSGGVYGNFYETVTGPGGQFTFTGVTVGDFQVYPGEWGYGYSDNYPIDNCRPVNGAPRNIRLDLPSFVALFNNVPF